MQPEDNNPLANPGVPDFSSANPANIPSGVTNNNPNTLGNFAPVDPVMGDNSGYNAAAMSNDAPALPSIDEPLTPAAPVPGSIGSVTSGPTVMAADQTANPFAPAADTMTPNLTAAPTPTAPATDAASTPDHAAEPAATATSEAPAHAPYNPFATPAKTDTDTAPAVKPAFQPAPSSVPASATPKIKNPFQNNHLLTIILGALSAILLITTIIFLALYINAKNNPKIVYVPTTSENDSNSRLQILTCSAQGEEMIDTGELISTSSTITATYVGGKISGLTNEMAETYPTADQAIAMRDMILALSATEGYPYKIEQSIEDTTFNLTLRPTVDPLTDDAAAEFVYGTDYNGQSVAVDNLEEYYTAKGANCTLQ